MSTASLLDMVRSYTRAYGTTGAVKVNGKTQVGVQLVYGGAEVSVAREGREMEIVRVSTGRSVLALDGDNCLTHMGEEYCHLEENLRAMVRNPHLL